MLLVQDIAVLFYMLSNPLNIAHSSFHVILHKATGFRSLIWIITYCSFSLELQASTILCINWHFLNSCWQGREKGVTNYFQTAASEEIWTEYLVMRTKGNTWRAVCSSILVLHGWWGWLLFHILPLCLAGCQFGREAKPESRLCISPPECEGNCSICIWNTYPADRSKMSGKS